VYAYSVSLWTLVCGAWLVLAQSAGRGFRRFLGLCVVAGLAAVVLSAQRSAVWALLPALAFVVLSGPLRLKRTFALIGLLAIIVGASVFGSLSMRADNNPVARLFERQDAASDPARERSWGDALEVLEVDPYFGLAFRTYGGDTGDHNGLLGGWAEYGLIWLLGTLGAILLTCRYFMSSSVSRGCRLAGLLFVGMMLVNATFHTLMVGRGDMVFFVLLGALLGLSQVTSNTRRRVSASPRR
jgi:O-antigen ligase